MRINILSTGSKGNCAIIDNGQSKIMIDCGLKFEDIITHKAFGKFSDYEVCLETHKHIDHSKSTKEFAKFIDIIDTNNIANKSYDFEHWKVLPFEVQHNIKCYGYLIKDKISGKNILWATDFNNIPILNGVRIDIACLECNYDEETITKKIINCEDTYSHYEYHNSLENLVGYMEQLPRKLNMLVLLHKSNDSNLNEYLAIEKLNNFAERVLIAEKNMEIEYV